MTASCGSAATSVRCGGICSIWFVANLLLNSSVKEFWKSINISRSYAQKNFGVFFYAPQCISLESQWADVFNDILSVRNIVHFSHTKIHSKMPFEPTGENPQYHPFPLGDVDPHLIDPSLDLPHSPPKQHPDTIDRLAAEHPPDWRTDWWVVRPTDGWTDRPLDWPTDRPTDRWTDWLMDQLTRMPAYAVLYWL